MGFERLKRVGLRLSALFALSSPLAASAQEDDFVDPAYENRFALEEGDLPPGYDGPSRPPEHIIPDMTRVRFLEGGFMTGGASTDRAPRKLSFDPYMPIDKIPAIPAFKNRIITEKSWMDWNREAIKLVKKEMAERKAQGKDCSYAASLLFTLRTLYVLEGGADVSPKGGSARAGVMNRTLADMKTFSDRGDPFLKSLKKSFADVKKSKNLSNAQLAAAMRFDLETRLIHVGGVAGAFKGTDPFAMAAILDTAFRYGNTGGAKIVSHALNELNKGLPGWKDMHETHLTPNLFNTYREWATGDQLPQLLDGVAASRNLLAKSQGPGDKIRTDALNGNNAL